MSSDWQRLANVWYRKREIYSALWADQPRRLEYSVVAGAPYGGPVATVRDEHVLQPVRGALKPELQTWTSAGRLIAAVPWPHSGLLSMGWSADEDLVCVFESGVVRTYTVLCEPKAMFTVDSRIEAEGGAILASLWSTGLAIMSRKASLFVNASWSRSGEMCQRCADLKVQSVPLCMCALPPYHEGSTSQQVIVGTAEGPVLLVDKTATKDLGIDEGPYNSIAVSGTGLFVACLSVSGVFKVFGIGDLSQQLDVANIECRKKPKQMVWCGDDCIALYLVVPTPSNGFQHVLFVGGPQNDWIPYQYDTPLHLVSECDGCRILGTNRVEFVQKVPPSTEAIFSIGSCDPPAMLCYAHEQFEKGDVCAQESLRLIKDELAKAVGVCIDAASYEHEPSAQKALLSAAAFGKHFLQEAVDPPVFMQVCQNLRICAELRRAPREIPMTVPQLEQLGLTRTVQRLLQRHEHLIAVRICEWVGSPCEEVLHHWATEKVRRAKGSAATDEELCQAILERFKHPRSGSGRRCRADFAKVAQVAAENYRPHLATMLLEREPRGRAQVQVLLHLSSRESSEESQMLMLWLAAEKAVQAGDPDLIYSVITAALGSSDIAAREADSRTMLKLLKERPQDLQVLGDVYVSMLLRAEQFTTARAFYGQSGRPLQAALCIVQQTFSKTRVEERLSCLRLARDFLGQTDSSTHESDRAAMQFAAQVTADEAELLKLQIDLEEKSSMKKWPNGPHKFAGLSLIDTLRSLIALQEIAEADALRVAAKLNDKRYWCIKVRALADAKNFQELNAMATHRTSPVGYDLVIEEFLKHGCIEYAKAFVPKVKSAEAQVNYYTRMGMTQEAQQVREQRGERGGAGGLFQSLLRGM